eukprot:6155589-Pyramimonas_sp.AAC.1
MTLHFPRVISPLCVIHLHFGYTLLFCVLISLKFLVVVVVGIPTVSNHRILSTRCPRTSLIPRLSHRLAPRHIPPSYTALITPLTLCIP